MQRKQGRNETKCLQATRTARLTGSPSVLRLGKQERQCFGVVRKEGDVSQASCCRFSPLWPLVHAAGALPSGARSVDECAKFMCPRRGNSRRAPSSVELNFLPTGILTVVFRWL